MCPDRHFGLLKLGWQTIENVKKKVVTYKSVFCQIFLDISSNISVSIVVLHYLHILYSPLKHFLTEDLLNKHTC